MIENPKKEKILNPANIITSFRLIFAFLAVYLIVADFDIIYIVFGFIGGMLTDFFDGLVARRFKTETEFGRKFDMVADRILMVGVATTAVIKFSISGVLSEFHLFQIFIILSREIITLPMAIVALIKGAGIPKVRFSGKLTTFFQAITFPMILLGASYAALGKFSLYFALANCGIGLFAASQYIGDIKRALSERTENNKEILPKIRA